MTHNPNKQICELNSTQCITFRPILNDYLFALQVVKGLTSFMYVLELKNSDYLQQTSYIVNGSSISLLRSIIYKSHKQVAVV